MHMLAAAGETAPDRIGRPRRSGESVEIEPGGPAEPVDADEAAERLSALASLLAAPTGAPALVIAGVALGELLATTPFGWGDGIIARAVFRLVLAQRGLDPQSLAVAEVGFVELGVDARRDALADYAEGDATGIAEWLVHCSKALVIGVRESTAVCESMMRG
jgi:hypothetical protein